MSRRKPKVRIAELVSPDGTSRITFGWFDGSSAGSNQDVTVTMSTRLVAGNKVIHYDRRPRVRGTVLRSDSRIAGVGMVTVRELIRKPEGQRIIWDVPAFLLDLQLKS